MAQYQYTGLDPEEAPDGSGLARPLDVREFDEAPEWGAWTPVPDDAESPPAAPGIPVPAPPPVTPPAAPAPADATPAAPENGS